jgi:tetratricopeptide (TPR) repeat protein
VIGRLPAAAGAAAALLLSAPAGAQPASPQPPPSVEDLKREFQKGAELTQAGHLFEAEAIFRRLAAAFPSVPELHYNLGYIAMERRDWDAAQVAFKKALELRPGERRTEGALSSLHDARTRKDVEREPFTAALKERTEARSAFVRAAELADRGSVTEAREALDVLLKTAPAAPELHFNRVLVLLRQKDTAGAQAEYEEALRLKPDYVDAALALGRLHAQANRRDEALAVLTRAASTSERDPRIHLAIGLNRLDAVKNEEAEAALKKAEALDPGLAEVQYRLAVLAISANRPEEARMRLGKYLTMPGANPVNVETARDLLRMLPSPK